MSTDNPGIDISLPAADDLSTKQYYAVKVDSSGNAAVAGAGQPAIGVLQNKPDAADQHVAALEYGQEELQIEAGGGADRQRGRHAFGCFGRPRTSARPDTDIDRHDDACRLKLRQTARFSRAGKYDGPVLIVNILNLF
jgi:hypothetical protein